MVNFFCGISAIKLTSVSDNHNHLRNSSIYEQETEKISGKIYLIVTKPLPDFIETSWHEGIFLQKDSWTPLLPS